MKAIVYTTYGEPDVLQVGNVPKPVLADDELLIRVEAAEATKSDCELRSFRFSVKWFWLPLRLTVGVRKPRRTVLGGYFSGVVEEIGAAVTRFTPGDEVFGATGLRMGGYGEYIAVREGSTIGPKPANMSFEEAAAVPLGGLNALHFMRRAAIQPGERVLINGAGGSIGAHGAQIAKAMGANVTAVDAGHKEVFLRRVGADHFIDYTREKFLPMAPTYDVVFDMVPGSDFGGLIDALKPGGRYLTGNPRFAIMLRSVLTSWFTDKTASFAFARETTEELATLRAMIEAGQIQSIVDRVYPMKQAAEAHRHVETEERLGAIVLTIA